MHSTAKTILILSDNCAINLYSFTKSCPGIFPPHQTMQTVNSDDEEGSIKARNLDAVIVPKNAPDPEEKSDDVLVFSILGAIIGLVIIGLVIFCVLRYLQFRRRYHIGKNIYGIVHLIVGILTNIRF